jgi:hypothetical protein
MDSVANVSQLVAVDKELLTERTGSIDRRQFALVLSGIDVVLGRWGSRVEASRMNVSSSDPALAKNIDWDSVARYYDAYVRTLISPRPPLPDLHERSGASPVGKKTMGP